MEKPEKEERQLERIIKGFANHRRIEMMRLLQQRPDLSLLEVCKSLRIGIKTGSEHMRRLALAGLVAKRNDWRWVRHRLTQRGVDILAFLRTLA
ncbi:MAG: winged helix-turn-helix transcriptional regulator [Planctomycetes bacterium]|nr:winged helix-turn-helix transcriptional regulator [Planctomycetota bacterium]